MKIFFLISFILKQLFLNPKGYNNNNARTSPLQVYLFHLVYLVIWYINFGFDKSNPYKLILTGDQAWSWGQALPL